MARKEDENEFTDTTVNRAALGLRTHAVNDVGPTPTSVAATNTPVKYRNRDGSITDVPFDGNSVPVGTDFQPPTRQNTGPVAHPQVSKVRYSNIRPAAEANIADFSQLPAGATTNAELQNQFSRGIGGPTTNDVPEPVTVAKGLRRPNVPGSSADIIEKFENEVAAAGTQEVESHTPARIAEYQDALRRRAGVPKPTPKTPANMFQGIPGHDVPDMLSNPVQTPLRIAGTAVEAAGNLDRSLQENKSAPLWMRAVSKAGADLAPKVTGALHGAADKVRDFGESQRQAMKDYLGDTPDRSGPYDSSSSPTGAPKEPVSLLRERADPNATFSLQGADYVPSYAKGEQVSPLRQPPVKNSKGQTVLPDGSILLDHTTVDTSTFNEDGTANNGIGSPGPRFSGGGPTSVQLGYNPSQSSPVDSLARPGSISGRRGSRLELPAGEVVNLGNDRYAQKSVRELSRSGGPVRQNFTINHAGPFAGYDGPITNQTLKHFADQKRAKMVSAAANGGNILRQISAAQGRAKRAYNKALDAGMNVSIARDLAKVEMEGIKDLVDARGDTLQTDAYRERTASDAEYQRNLIEQGYSRQEVDLAMSERRAQSDSQLALNEELITGVDEMALGMTAGLELEGPEQDAQAAKIASRAKSLIKRGFTTRAGMQKEIRRATHEASMLTAMSDLAGFDYSSMEDLQDGSDKTAFRQVDPDNPGSYKRLDLKSYEFWKGIFRHGLLDAAAAEWTDDSQFVMPGTDGKVVTVGDIRRQLKNFDRAMIERLFAPRKKDE